MHDGKINIVSTEQKLLFDIRELLMEQNKLLNTVINSDGDNKRFKAVEVVDNEIILPAENKGLECELCGGIHESIGKKLACAKKFKRNGGK
jgi:hypothetical protein